jgi:hypothetical protein
MLLVALLSMFGSIFFLLLHNTPDDYPIPEDKEEENAYLGKIAIVVFTVIGTLCFLTIQCLWYKRFFLKLARVNRDITIDEKSRMTRALSTIRKLK